MRDVEILLQKCDVAEVLKSIGIHFERRRNARGHELYFPCVTKNHESDPGKKRMSVAESGKYKGMFNCWSCEANGNLIHLIRAFKGLSFEDAIFFLEEKYGTSELIGTEALEFNLRMTKEVEDRGPIEEIQLPPDSQIIFNSPTAKYAIDWLVEERKIAPDKIEQFNICWGTHKDIGQCIIIPIIFEGKLVSAFFVEPKNGGLKRYPAGPTIGRVLFNYDRCLQYGKYVMVESILDAIRIESLTGQPSMACFTNMISQAQLDLLVGDKFLSHGIMPDLDGVRGWDLVDRMVGNTEKLMGGTGRATLIYFTPIGKDPGDCSNEELLESLQHPMMYSEYQLNQHLSQITHENNTVTSIHKK